MQPLGGLYPQIESRGSNQSDRELPLFSQEKKKDAHPLAAYITIKGEFL